MYINNLEEIKNIKISGLTYEQALDELHFGDSRYSKKYDYDVVGDFITAYYNYIEILKNDRWGYLQVFTTIRFYPDGKIKGFYCDECNDDEICEHVYKTIILIQAEFGQVLKKFNIVPTLESKDFLALFKNNKKESASLDLELISQKEEQGFELKIKIGNNKKYMLSPKLNAFLYSYFENGDQVIFGKNFIYDSNMTKFSKIDASFLEFLPLLLDEKPYSYMTNNKYNYESKIYLNDLGIVAFLDKMLTLKKEFTFISGFKHYDIKKINDNFSVDVSMNKDGNDLKIFLNNKVDPLVTDFSYVFQDEELYKLTNEQKLFLKQTRRTESLIVEEKDIKTFDKNVFPHLNKISKKIKLAEDLEEKYKFVKPDIQLYFDYSNGINCKIIALYNDIEINLLENIETEFIRDYLEENKAKNYVETLGFVLHEKKPLYVMEDDNDIINFIENIISEIKDYKVFVTNTLKEVNYIKRPTVSANISLGKNELLACDFNIEGVLDEELYQILESINIKKKYHKLKNGSYINLDDNAELEQFSSLIQALDIDYKTLKNNKNIVIPKYKALYISSRSDEFLTTDTEFLEFVDNFKQARNKKLQVYKPENAILRDYQIKGINWLQNIVNYGFGGILADEMGLGKTLQTIMFVKSRLEEDRNREILIVSPTSLIYNWESEFLKFAPDIKVKVIAEVRPKREKIFEELHNYEVFITSYGLLREDLDKYKEVKYDTFVIDEAQAIKNVNALITQSVKQIVATNKIALTGTPIENSISELYSIFDFIMPGYFGSVTNFNKKYGKLLNESDDLKQSFHSLVNPFILRRKKVDVLKELPDKIERNIVVDLGNIQKKYYLMEVKKVNDQLKNSVSEGTFSKNKMLILQSLTRLRQICISPSLYVENYEGENAKIEALIETVSNAILENHKILIFSQFTSALGLIKKEFLERNIDYYYLDGSTKAMDRIRLVNEFNESNKISVFLISLKAGGNGLNLTSADIVMHLDPWWNPAVENQATDRAHRIGQKNVVEVIKFIAKGTIEEKILKLQGMKKELSEFVVDGKENTDTVLTKLTEKDILYLLSNE